MTYNNIGEAHVGVNFDFIAKALTEQGLEEDTLTVNQFFKVKSFEYNEEHNLIVFECDLFEHMLN